MKNKESESVMHRTGGIAAVQLHKTSLPIIIGMALCLLVFFTTCRTSSTQTIPSFDPNKIKLFTNKLVSLKDITISPSGNSVMILYSFTTVPQPLDTVNQLIQIDDTLYGPYYQIKDESYDASGKQYSFKYQLPMGHPNQKNIMNTDNAASFWSAAVYNFFGSFKKKANRKVGVYTDENFMYRIRIGDTDYPLLTEIDYKGVCLNCIYYKNQEGIFNYVAKDKNNTIIKNYGPFYNYNYPNIHYYTRDRRWKMIHEGNKGFFLVSKDGNKTGPHHYPHFEAASYDGKSVAFKFSGTNTDKKGNEYLKINKTEFGPYFKIDSVSINPDGDDYIFGYQTLDNAAMQSQHQESLKSNLRYFIHYKNKDYQLKETASGGIANYLLDSSGKHIGFFYITRVLAGNAIHDKAQDEIDRGWGMYHNLYVFINGGMSGPYAEGVVRVTNDNRVIVAHQKKDGYLYITEVH